MSNKKNKLSYFFDFSEVANYFFRKKDPKRKTNFSLKAMHTVNKISIIMFLLGILFIIFRRLI